MAPTLRCARALFALGVLAACSSHIPVLEYGGQVNQDPGAGRRLDYAVMYGCLAPGIPSSAVRHILGRPRQVQTTGDGQAVERWSYALDRAGRSLQIDISADTVIAWHAWVKLRGQLGTGLHGVPRQVAERVGRYLRVNPAAEDNVLYAMLNGCLLVGMDSMMVLVSLGPPAAVDSAPMDSAMALAPLGGPFAVDSVTAARWRSLVRWVYSLSSLGDRLEVDFARGHVTDFRAKDTWRP